MGILGLCSFIRDNDLFLEHSLHDTILVIDGLNLQYELHDSYLHKRSDLRYGGDYTHQVAFITRFFTNLLDCGITPIVIMDGIFRKDKIDNILKRYDEQIARALAVYQEQEEPKTRNTINCLFGPNIFIEVIKVMGIRYFQAVYEADEIVAQIGCDLRAPVLSDDSDFLLMPKLRSGIVSTKSLVRQNYEAQIDPGSGMKYIKCEFYHVKSLKQFFPGLKYEMIPLASALLSNDYLDYKKANRLINKLPSVGQRFQSVRQNHIFTVFEWLAKHESRQSALAALRKLCDESTCFTSDHPLIKNITDHCSQLRKSTFDPMPIGEYLCQNKSYLFPKEPNIPDWAHSLYMKHQIEHRLISITQLQLDVLAQVIEDFSVEDSIYQAGFGLCKRIYGLLRTDDDEVKKVQRIGRKGTNRADLTVTPEYTISNVRLPTISKISFLSESARISLFFTILDLDPALVSEIKQIFTATFPIDDYMLSQFITPLISFIYLNRHLELPLSIEFLYSLLANFLFMRHFSTVKLVPTLLNLDSGDHERLLTALVKFDKLPERANYQPRIVHFYNSFQAVLKNVRFLSQILDLTSVFNVDLFLCGLQGTFIYNLSMDLADKDKPLSHLEHQLLYGVNSKVTALFQQLLDFILQNSARKYIVTGKTSDSRDVVPAFVRVTRSSLGEGDRLLVRALKKEMRKKPDMIELADQWMPYFCKSP